MKRIYLTLPDGRVRKISPSPSTLEASQAKGETEEQYLAARMARAKEVGVIPEGADYVILDDSQVPGRGELDVFRDAWKLKRGAIEIDMPRAREVQKARLRRERAPLLAALDADWSRAVAKGDAKAAQEIEAQRQALRDVTIDPAIDAATSPDDLKAIRAQDRLTK
jgi:hypothetical protein